MNVLDVKTQESLSRVLHKKVKTSDKDYEVFKKTFMRVVEMLGLTQYEYTFTKLKNCDDDAGVAFEKFGPGCIVHLADEVSSFIHKRGMKSLAVHEALHVLLRPYDVWLFPEDGEEILTGSEQHTIRMHTIHSTIQRLVPVILASLKE